MKKKKKSRVLPILRTVTGFLCLILFASFAVCALSIFKWIPWYDDSSMPQLLMVFLWIPECIISVIHILLLFASRTIYRPRVMLICANSLLIPLYYTFGLMNVSGNGVYYAIAICSVVLTLLFVVVHIRSIKNKTV